MKTLVTGATGFVGGHLVDRLLAAGHDVTALVRNPGRASHLANRGVRLVAGDLQSPEALAMATDGAEVVFHLAAVTGAMNEAGFFEANRDGTVNLLRAATARAPEARFIYLSSMSAGGPTPRDQLPIPDGEHDHPVTMYGRSKLAGEHAVAAASLPWAILRAPAVYGPGDRDNFLGVFRLARRGWAPVFGDGRMEACLIHVEDLADACLAAAGGESLGQRWYVNHPERLSSIAIVRAIGAVMGREVRVLHLPRWMAAAALEVSGFRATRFRKKTILWPDKIHEFFAESWVADPQPFSAATGWQPRFDHRQGFVQTADWYRKQGWL